LWLFARVAYHPFEFWVDGSVFGEGLSVDLKQIGHLRSIDF
jgi:hypothetical protein